MERRQRKQRVLFREAGYSNAQQRKRMSGDKNLKVQNKSLLMKWLWRYINEERALWKEVIIAKYGELNPWCSEMVSKTLWARGMENNQIPMDFF